MKKKPSLDKILKKLEPIIKWDEEKREARQLEKELQSLFR